ncbi:MAG TPA: class I SAM-dependent methyltransferase [Nitrospirales bacterium]|nr:SAM-dependent methyltransferase [Nitrospiraceae bacterium]HNP31487.1 class I SAM-dependent methyltransferase [Nitrospirales bacterium]
MKRGWYARRVFPRLVHWSMGQAGFIPLRQSLVSQASGLVLEIGFGTGANFPFYPSHIDSLTAIDPNSGMIPLACSHLTEEVTPVHLALAAAEDLPFPSAFFDTIVSTMTLCSVSLLSKALQELLRVVRPGGQLLFLEHGQSPDRSVRRWQDGLTPVWKHFGDGCHLNRPMVQMIQAEGWTVTALENFYLPGVPKPFAYFSQGMAVKA